MKIIFMFLLMTYSVTALENNELMLDSTTFPIIIGGVSIPMNINFVNGSTNQLGDNLYCCNGLNISDASVNSGTTIELGVIYGNLDSLSILKSVSYGSKASLSWFRNTYSGNSDEIPRKVYTGDNVITEFHEVGTVNVRSDYIKLFMSFNLLSYIDTNLINYNGIGLKPTFSFGIGPLFGLQVSEYAEQFVEIADKNNYTYVDGSSRKKVADGSLTNSNDFLFGLGANITCYWNLQQLFETIKFNNLFISLNLSYDYYLSSLIRNQEITLQQVGINLGFNWYFFDKNN